MSCHFLPQCSSACAPFYGLPILQTHATAARIRSASSATAAAAVLGCQGSKFSKLPGHPKSHPGHTQVLGTPSCVSKSSQLLLLRIPLKLQQNVGKNGGEKRVNSGLKVKLRLVPSRPCLKITTLASILSSLHPKS